MALLQNVIQRGTHASRPAAGSAGIQYFETDTGQLFRDNGSSWDLDDTTLLYTAKGQLLASSASAAVGALAAGTNGYVLTADSTQTLGVKWAATASGVATFSWVTKSANYTLTTADTGVLVDATSGNLTMTLPTAVGATALYTIKKKDSSAHTVAIATTSSQTIDGFSSVTLADQLQAVTLMSDGSNWYSAPTPAVMPAVRCANSANQSITSATVTALTFDTNRYDQGTTTAQHSTSSNTSRLTCQVAGVYDIAGQVQWAGSASGVRRHMRLRLNGSTVIAEFEQQVTSSGAAPYQIVSTQYQLAVSDYVELLVFHDASGSLNVVAEANSTNEFMWARIG